VSFSAWQKLAKIENEWQARRQYARMKHSAPLLKGRCRLCERQEDTLYPIVIDLCKKCSEHLPELKARLIKIHRHRLHPGECMRCGTRCPTTYQFNIDICVYCLGRFDPSGRRQHIV